MPLCVLWIIILWYSVQNSGADTSPWAAIEGKLLAYYKNEALQQLLQFSRHLPTILTHNQSCRSLKKDAALRVKQRLYSVHPHNIRIKPLHWDKASKNDDDLFSQFQSTSSLNECGFIPHKLDVQSLGEGSVRCTMRERLMALQEGFYYSFWKNDVFVDNRAAFSIYSEDLNSLNGSQAEKCYGFFYSENSLIVQVYDYYLHFKGKRNTLLLPV